MNRRAIQFLILATLLWGLSFPVIKALTLIQGPAAATTWFFASLLNVYRFGIATLVLFLFALPTLRRFTRRELSQGLGLGIFSGLGLLLQVDGLAHTAASTSAFLTQATCLFIPLYVACRECRWPTGRVFLSCGLVLIGGAVLAGVDWRHLRLGRGECETILAAGFFAGQIIWLNRPEFARNNVNHFSLVMFAVTALVSVPVAIATTAQPHDWIRAWQSPSAILFLGILILPCTFGAYMLMNHWQPHVTSTQAGLIYCFEPVFASAFALCLPEIFSRWAGVEYANERLTASLLIGGALITLANVIMLKPAPEPAAAVSSKPSPT